VFERVLVLRYNYHNAGNKYTKVYMPSQMPKKDKQTGEWTVDLLEDQFQKKPTILGIFPKHLFLPQGSKRRRL